jgi:hypothetical protein
VVFGQPLHLHYAGACQTTACTHCSSCGLGPQSCLTYRYVTDQTVDADGLHYLGSYMKTLTPGLCAGCSAAA